MNSYMYIVMYIYGNNGKNFDEPLKICQILVADF